MSAKVWKFAAVGMALLCAAACHGMSAEKAARRERNEKALARARALEEAVSQKNDWPGRSEPGAEHVLREDLQAALFEGIRAAKIDADSMEELVLRLPVAPSDIDLLQAMGPPDTPVRGVIVCYVIDDGPSKPIKEIILLFTLEGVLHSVDTAEFALFDEAECDVELGDLTRGGSRILGCTYPKGRRFSL